MPPESKIWGRLVFGLSVCLSVPRKTLTLGITFEWKVIELSYFICVLLVTIPFHWYQILLPNNVTLTLIFDVLFKNFNIGHNFLAHLSSSFVNFYIWHLLCNHCTEFHETVQKLSTLYQVCVFSADWSTNMAAECFDWLTHFQHLLCKHCKEILWNLAGCKYSRSFTNFFMSISQRILLSRALICSNIFATSSLRQPLV